MSEHQSTHKTCIGSFCTLSIFVLLVLYACDKLIIQQADNHERYNESKVFDETIKFEASDGLNLAFALTDYEGSDPGLLENEKQASLQFYLYSWGNEKSTIDQTNKARK